MKADTKIKAEITLTLTAEEALFLKGLVQNPQCHPDEELPEEAIMRERFFNSLPDIDFLHRAIRS